MFMSWLAETPIKYHPGKAALLETYPVVTLRCLPAALWS
jgi:hypothetical protein